MNTFALCPMPTQVAFGTLSCLEAPVSHVMYTPSVISDPGLTVTRFGLHTDSLRIAHGSPHKTTTALRLVVFLLFALAISLMATRFATSTDVIRGPISHQPDLIGVMDSDSYASSPDIQISSGSTGSLSLASTFNIFSIESYDSTYRGRVATLFT